ncbi:MAG: hypothetical protein AAFY41_01195 [Bacteroidota bacterium]
MKSYNITDLFSDQIKLLKKEKAADYVQFQDRMILTSLDERERNGVTWYPIRLVKDFISTGDRITLEIEKIKNQDQKHSFQVGAVVGVFSGNDEKKVLNGVVGYLKEGVMRIVLNQSYLPDWLNEDKLGVNLLFDDSTYREMDRALHLVMQAKNSRLAELRDIFYGERKARFQKGFTYELPTLNTVHVRMQHLPHVQSVRKPCSEPYLRLEVHT